MADYSSAGINTLYGTILGLNSGNISASLKTVQDGDGNNTALQVSTGSVKSTGTLESTGNATIGGNLTANALLGDGVGLDGVHNADFAIRTVTSGTATMSDTDQVLILSGTTSALGLAVASDLEGKRIIVANVTSGSIAIDFNGETIFNNGNASTSGLSARGYSGYTLLATATGWVLLSGTLV